MHITTPELNKYHYSYSQEMHLEAGKRPKSQSLAAFKFNYYWY